jgi:ArsR family transcriptional regulator, virulence genes transcriptional regulator
MDIDFGVFQHNTRQASKLLKAMCNERRLMILCQLMQGEKCVGELERTVRLSQSAMSQHLARLRNDSLVQTRRAGQAIFYSLAGSDTTSVIEVLHGIFCDNSGTAVERPIKGS